MINERAIALFVHVFTASGLLAGFMAVFAIYARDWRTAMAWLLVALLIDGIDGTLARKFRVKEVLPRINGKTIDTVVDFTNYALIPAYFFYAAELAGQVWSLPLAFLILLVSAIYYGKEGMVSDDYYFIGFPVMWNVVVFYLVFVFAPGDSHDPLIPLSRPPALLNATIVVIFSILHFVPIKFAYPSRATHMKTPTLIATAGILVLMPVVVWLYPNVPAWIKVLAFANLAYFGALAAYDTFRREDSSTKDAKGR